jgi:hypothetical protein
MNEASSADWMGRLTVASDRAVRAGPVLVAQLSV